MRRIAFIVAVLGIGVLVFLVNQGGVLVSSIDDLEGLEINQRVVLEGVVDSERIFGDFYIFDISGIDVVCNCEGSWNGESVKVLGRVSEYEGKKQVEVLRISRVD